MADITGFSHVALTVRDLAQSKGFYADVFGLQAAVDTDDLFIGAHPSTGLLFGLRKHEGQTGDEFTHLRTGLDHISFAVSGKDELENWERRFDELGVSYSPIEQSQFGWHLNFRDPDNIPLELFVLEM